jgi:hypothetical protein
MFTAYVCCLLQVLLMWLILFEHDWEMPVRSQWLLCRHVCGSCRIALMETCIVLAQAVLDASAIMLASVLPSVRDEEPGPAQQLKSNSSMYCAACVLRACQQTAAVPIVDAAHAVWLAVHQLGVGQCG